MIFLDPKSAGAQELMFAAVPLEGSQGDPPPSTTTPCVKCGRPATICQGDYDIIEDGYVNAQKELDRRDAAASVEHQHDHRDKGWRTDWRGRFWVKVCECGDERELLEAPASVEGSGA